MYLVLYIAVTFLALVLTCFCMTKGRATYFRPETIVASFLHLIVLLLKVLFIHGVVLSDIVALIN